MAAVQPFWSMVSGSQHDASVASARQNQSTCVEPDSHELMRSVSGVLWRRIRDNEMADSKLTLPMFCEDTHTEPEAEDKFSLSMPLLHFQVLACPALYTLEKLPPPPTKPRAYQVPDEELVMEFLENIWHKARLTPQSLVITLIYVVKNGYGAPFRSSHSYTGGGVSV